jgi:hypothetical protein
MGVLAWREDGNLAIQIDPHTGERASP